MRKVIRLGLGLVLGLILGCSDAMEPGDQPIRLSGVMKLAADSLTVSLRIANTSDTTQVLEWLDCSGYHPTNVALYRNAGLTQPAWEQPRSTTCPAVLGELVLAPGESGLIRGYPVPVAAMLSSVAAGDYYVAIQPLDLMIKPLRGSVPTRVAATVPVGRIELR